MMDATKHVEFEELSDLIDGTLDVQSSRKAEEHLSTCTQCSIRRDSLLSMVKSARELPRSVLPPDDIWPELRRELNARKDLVLPTAETAPSTPKRSTSVQSISWRMRAILAVAAVVLIVVSSAVTALVLRRADPIADSGKIRDSGTAPVIPVLRPDFVQAEAEYQRAIDELRLAVDTQRSQLNPETVRTIDHTLAVVDSAIAEARAALLADPNNQMLVDLLSASYQRKLDLLRRTSELGSRT